MSRKRPEDMKVKRCGCIDYDYGPPFICNKHQEAQERGLRRIVREEAAKFGHDLVAFSEYESQPGKWTSFCSHCCYIVIVYDTPQRDLDQVNGPQILEKECTGEGKNHI